MQADILSELRCPVSNGPLTLDTTTLAAQTNETFYGQEICEGLLYCAESATHYPTIAGVAILVANPMMYIASNYSHIISQSVPHLSPAILEYLQSQELELYGSEAADSWSILHNRHLILGHYDTTIPEVPRTHPVRKLLDDDAENWYDGLVRLLDPNKLSDDGTVAITNYTISRDGTRVAYCVSHQGSEWQMIPVLDTITLQVLPDRIEWCKFADIAWKHNSSGFFYSRMLAPDEVTDPAHRNRNFIYWHTLGTPQSADQLIYEYPEAPDLCFSPIVSSDEAYLILDVRQGTRPENQPYYREMNSTASFTPLIDTADASYTFIATIGTLWYVHTDLDAPRGRVVAIDLEHPQRAHWRDIISEQAATLAQATLVQNRLVVVYTHDVQHHVHVYHLDGSLDHILDIPPHSAVVGLAGFTDDNEIFLAIESFLDARTILRHVVGGQEVERVTQTHVDFPLSDYRTEQITYRSPDGTTIPMYMVHHKDLQLDGTNPVLLTGYGGFGISMMPGFILPWLPFLLTGYGGFGISMMPGFILPWLPWLEMGGVYVVANIRGGGEYGEEWHRAGMGQYRQHVFDDFIAAAEWLIAERYTCREKLAIYGNSNGGLLVATCMVQRPDLFGAVICQSPLIDMLRYHHFTVGSYWIPEYGCADDPEDFASLYAYSPLHNIRPDVNYPACLVLIADTDDRVVPAHAKKFVATLQASSNGEDPLLLRIEQKAGHGQGKPTAKVIDEYSDIYTFLWNALRQR